MGQGSCVKFFDPICNSEWVLRSKSALHHCLLWHKYSVSLTMFFSPTPAAPVFLSPCSHLHLDWVRTPFFWKNRTLDKTTIVECAQVQLIGCNWLEMHWSAPRLPLESWALRPGPGMGSRPQDGFQPPLLSGPQGRERHPACTWLWFYHPALITLFRKIEFYYATTATLG